MENTDLTARIQAAIDRFSDREVYGELMLASSPAAAKKIAESLPGVKDLVAIGPDAGPAVQDLLNREASNDNQLTTIALYLLSRMPTDTRTTDSLARPLASQQFTGINAELAGEVFLNSLGQDVNQEDRYTTAVREAKKRIEQNPP
ncbi:MAG TPA: hypothetical protein VIG25_01655 [Pyrinomonadaceae bacterium]|jgi:hypothetical protein